MPRRPAPPCRKPGCPHLRPCPTEGHEPTPWADSSHNQHRTISGSAEQARARRIIDRDHGICHVCHQPGADQADHVIPFTEGGADDEANMAAIHARPCHQAKTSAEAARARRG